MLAVSSIEMQAYRNSNVPFKMELSLFIYYKIVHPYVDSEVKLNPAWDHTDNHTKIQIPLYIYYKL